MTKFSHIYLHSRRHFLKLSAGSAIAGFWAVAGCRPAVTPFTGAGEPMPVPTIADPPVETAQAELFQENDTLLTQPQNVLRLALVVLPTSLDPAFFTVIEAYPFGFAVYDGLVWVDGDLQPQPMLAESWTRAPDHLSWTFQLRQDVTFHHGTPFTAQDVVYTFTRLLDPASESVLQPILSFVTAVEAIDDYTVRFLLNSPNVEFPLLLAAPQARIVAHDYADELLVQRPSGTGPFRFVELIPGVHMSFVRNLDYWAAEKIFVEELYHVVIDSFDAQVAALERGEIDLILDIDLAHLSHLQADPTITVVETPSGRYQNLAMRINEPPFDDPRIRRALKHCVDREDLLQQLLGGRGEIGHDHPIPPTHPLAANLPALPYDLAQARALVAEAGYETGLKLQLLTAEAAPSMVAFAELFRTMAAPANIDIEVIVAKIPADIYFSDYWGRVPFYVSAWDYRPSLHETFGIAYRADSPWNETGWFSEEMDALLVQAAGEDDETARRALYAQIQQILSDEGSVIIPYFQPVFTALRSHVQGYTPHPAGWVDLRGVKLIVAEP